MLQLSGWLNFLPGHNTPTRTSPGGKQPAFFLVNLAGNPTRCPQLDEIDQVTQFMERIIAIKNYVIVGEELMVVEAKQLVLDFMLDKKRRHEQRPVVFLRSGERERELWLRGEWERLGDVRPFDWEQV